MSKTITIPANCNPYVVVINNHVYVYKAGETVEVPDEVAEAIEDALELEPKPKRYLGKFAQLANGTLTEITASDLDGVENIVYYAFGQCYSLESAEIPDSVISIASAAFNGCNSLKSIKFGSQSKLKSIGTNAFDWCSSLEGVYLPKTPPVLANVNAFANIKDNCVFYCKSQESLNAYKVADNWSGLMGSYSFVVEE
jgi:hypothetical protein